MTDTHAPTGATRTPHPGELVTFLIDLPAGGCDLVVDATTFDQIKTAARAISGDLTVLQSQVLLARTIDYGRRVLRLEHHGQAQQLADLLLADDAATVADVLLALELRALTGDPNRCGADVLGFACTRRAGHDGSHVTTSPGADPLGEALATALATEPGEGA